MKTLTVAELRYLLAQLPPEFDTVPVIGGLESWPDDTFLVHGVRPRSNGKAVVIEMSNRQMDHGGRGGY
jgi:hypothetical protein